MPSNAQPVVMGPFVGGLNTNSDPTAIGDAELWDCVNLESQLDGSLISRPPIVQQNGQGGWTDHITMIGSAVISGVHYIVGSNSQGTYIYDGTTWTTVKNGLVSYSSVQIRDAIYIVAAPVSGQSGGYWLPSTGFTTDNAMPRGEKGVFHKNRLWIAPGFSSVSNKSRLQFTEPITGNTLNWLGTNFVDVSPGDGQNLVDLAVYDDNLLIFKNTSTYVYAFDLQPSDGSIQVVNPVVGVSARRCVVQYENSIFLFFQGNVFQVVDYAFQRVSEKVDFEYDGTSPGTRAETIFLCIMGDRLLFRYFNRIYSMSLRNGAWTRWVSNDSLLHNFGPLVKFPTETVLKGQDVYYAGSSIANVTKIFTIQDGFDETKSEAIECYLKTKIYDLTDSAHYKKMAWWGADILATQNVNARANPVAASYQTRWADVVGLVWPSQDIYIWDNPLTLPYAPVTDVDYSGAVQRRFYKFLKTVRFRQIYFELTIQTDGSPVTGPCRVFSATAMMSLKQTVSKQVT